jgi:hypothetical protein
MLSQALVVKLECSTLLIPRAATEHDAEPLTSASEAHNLYPLDPSWSYLPLSFCSYKQSFFKRFPEQMLSGFFVCPNLATCPAHHRLLHSTVLTHVTCIKHEASSYATRRSAHLLQLS